MVDGGAASGAGVGRGCRHTGFWPFWQLKRIIARREEKMAMRNRALSLMLDEPLSK